jgi:pimeloyl-ACP methyl ester carboxylesterase
MNQPCRPRRRDTLALLAGAAVLPVSAKAASGMDQTEFVWLGGIKQWISIRGEDAANPVLLVVHGGPGDVQWPFEDKYKPWEKIFTVVQWDQRGAGHTFGRYGKQTPDVTLARIAKDGVELADHLCRTLGKKKIIVLGHSWGSIVAVTMVEEKPDLFAAYVGTGQVSSWHQSVQSQFDLILAHARAANDEATIKELQAIGTPDPANTHQYFTFTRNFRSLWAPSDQEWLHYLRTDTTMRTKYPKDFQDAQEGMMFQGEHVLPDQVREDLPKSAGKIGTDFFVIQGADDVITPTKVAVDYFNMVEAPRKELVLIPGAGHFAFMTHTAPFLAALADKVRPAAIVNGA